MNIQRHHSQSSPAHLSPLLEGGYRFCADVWGHFCAENIWGHFLQPLLIVPENQVKPVWTSMEIINVIRSILPALHIIKLKINWCNRIRGKKPHSFVSCIFVPHFPWMPHHKMLWKGICSRITYPLPPQEVRLKKGCCWESRKMKKFKNDTWPTYSHESCSSLCQTSPRNMEGREQEVLGFAPSIH